jgi:hypothetical protein
MMSATAVVSEGDPPTEDAQKSATSTTVRPWMTSERPIAMRSRRRDGRST